MAISAAVDCRVGTIVWVQRKNGSWWPGRVVGPNELSPSHLISIRRTGTTPVKLLGREDATVDWYNVEKSKRIKAFRCGEFDDCIEMAESSQAYTFLRSLKYAHRVDAILHALELEKLEVQKKPERPVGIDSAICTSGEDWMGAVCRAKRSRCVYLPAESNHSLERTVFHSQPLQVFPSSFEDCSFQSGSAKECASSRSNESDSSKRNSQNRERDEAATKSSGSYNGRTGNMNCKENDELTYWSNSPPEDQTAGDFENQKWKVKGKLEIHNLNKRPRVVTDGHSFFRSKNGKCERGEMSTSKIDGSTTGFDAKSLETLVCEVNTLSHSPLGGCYLEDPSSQCFDKVYIGHQNWMETMLIDVDLTVQASYRGEHVPLVSLMSRLNGKAIIGHPVEVEASEDSSSEILLLPENDDVNDGTTMLQPVWRTSKRTPVSYLPCPCPSSIPKDDKPVQVCQNIVHLSLEARGNNSPPRQELLRKPQKKPSLSNHKRTTLSFSAEQKYSVSGGDLKRGSQSCVIDGLLKPEKSTSSIVTCVPVKLIFSKLVEGVGRLQR